MPVEIQVLLRGREADQNRRIELWVIGGRARLTVETGGRILDADEIREPAQPFRRLAPDRTGSDNGTGLGLSIVAAIAATHHGTLDLHARSQGGLGVEQIAKLSRVSPATVYAQCGGKQGLLRSLMDSWTQSPMVVEAQQEALAAADAVRVMQVLSTAYLRIARQWGDVTRVVIDVAPHDDESAAVLATARRRHNRRLTTICRHLEDIGALRDDVDARLASQIITYYYGIDGLLRTRDVFGWSLERSNEWLLAHASTAVLRSPAKPLSPN